MPSSTSVLVDTSTLFSGLGWSGPPARVLVVIATGDFELVLSDYILDELFEHLRDFPPDRKVPALRSFQYLQQAIVIEEGDWINKLDQAKPLVGEAKDAPIMAAYLLDGVDLLITSNTQDFPHDSFETIMTPRGFLDRFVPPGQSG